MIHYTGTGAAKAGGGGRREDRQNTHTHKHTFHLYTLWIQTSYTSAGIPKFQRISEFVCHYQQLKQYQLQHPSFTLKYIMGDFLAVKPWLGNCLKIKPRTRALKHQ